MRTSSVHYIAPSAISITPNANESQNDLAVYVARNTKIKVYAPKAGIDTIDSNYQEWSLNGRNRRLLDSEKPYTIFARLSKTDKSDGYLVFAPKTLREGEWIDKYSSVTLNGLSVLYQDNGLDVIVDDMSYWYIRLGDVSLPAESQRTVTFDTGILGTDQYNEEWELKPDSLPLRVELGCTIDDEDAGPTPYVGWGKSVVLSASLVEGWINTEIERFDHWVIERATNDAEADAAWNHPDGEGSYRGLSDGSITLSHARGYGDDFNGAVAAVFKVTAWGTDDSSDSSSSDGLVPIAWASITILAETLEKYELALSTNIVSFDPRSSEYTPAAGVSVRIRATDQRGETFELTKGQFDNANLAVQYAPVDSVTWTTLAYEGSSGAAAVATIPLSAFSQQKSLNVRLVKLIDTNPESEEDEPVAAELMRTTIAFVRDGEDSKEREWIYRLNSNVGYDNTTPNRDKEFQDDDFVPVGWTDDPVGVSNAGDIEYASWRDYDAANDTWGAFHEPRIWSRNGDDSIVYDIVPSVSVINADASGVVRSEGIIVRAYRTEGDTRSANLLPEGDSSSLDDSSSDDDYYYAEYSVDGGAWQQCDMFLYPDSSDSSDSSDIQELEYGIARSVVETATESIGLRLKHSSDPDAILKEIPPIKVVMDGEDAYTVQANPPTISFDCDQFGHSTDINIKEVAVSMFRGTKPATFTLAVASALHCKAWVSGTTLRISTGRAWQNGNNIYYTESPHPVTGNAVYDLSGTVKGTVTYVESSYAYIYINDVAERYMGLSNLSYHSLSEDGQVVVNVTSSDGVVRQLIIPVTGNKSGADGRPGSAGPMLYPAGQWEAKNYTANGDSRPYVLYEDGKYYYLSADAATPTDIPGPDSEVWTEMTQVDVVYAKFGIMDYGNMASAVFCGDWMYSEYGRLYSSASDYYLVDDISHSTNAGHWKYDEAYTYGGESAVPFAWFDPNYPMGGAANKFAPNWAVNLKTGQMYISSGKTMDQVAQELSQAALNANTAISNAAAAQSSADAAGAAASQANQTAQTASAAASQASQDAQSASDAASQASQQAQTADNNATQALNIANNLSTGNGNLLRNSGFTGDYLPESVAPTSEVDSGTPMYSDPFDHWGHENAQVVVSAESVTGSAAVLSNGSLQQTLEIGVEEGKPYVFSFKGKGTSLHFSVGGFSQTVNLDSTVDRYNVKFTAASSGTAFAITGSTCTVMELQLIEGNIPFNNWVNHPKDNDKLLAYFQNYNYLLDSIVNGKTQILGGLILSEIIKVGLYRNNQTLAENDETGGMSGHYNSADSPFIWGGGSMTKAFYTIAKYAENPNYEPTAEELANDMAQFVVTHGGMAILNNIIARGVIIATSGIFKNIASPNGKFRIDEAGNMSVRDATISGNMYAPLFSITPENISQYTSSGGTILLSLSGLNVKFEGFSEWASTMYLPAEEEYNGAIARIYNNSIVEIIMTNTMKTRLDAFGTLYHQITIEAPVIIKQNTYEVFQCQYFPKNSYSEVNPLEHKTIEHTSAMQQIVSGLTVGSVVEIACGIVSGNGGFKVMAGSTTLVDGLNSPNISWRMGGRVFQYKVVAGGTTITADVTDGSKLEIYVYLRNSEAVYRWVPISESKSEGVKPLIDSMAFEGHNGISVGFAPYINADGFLRFGSWTRPDYDDRGIHQNG